jgi:Uncharacterized conserved protein
MTAHAQMATQQNEQEIHYSEGTVKQINPARGLIIVHHPPIESLDWEEMTMVLPVTEKSLLQGIQVGDKVTFDLIMPDDVATISRISVVKP